MRSNIKLALFSLIPTSLLALIRHVVTQMTGNANFTTPLVKLLDMTALADALEAAIEDATNGSRQARITRDNLVEEGRDMLRKQADYVRGVANGDMRILESSGFELAKQREPIGVPGIPQNVKARTADTAGTVEFRWRSVHGAHLYEMWRSEVDPASGNATWVSIGVTTRTRNFITGLVAFKPYWFRVNAVGVSGVGLASAASQAAAA